MTPTHTLGRGRVLQAEGGARLGALQGLGGGAVRLAIHVADAQREQPSAVGPQCLSGGARGAGRADQVAPLQCRHDVAGEQGGTTSNTN